MNDLPPDAQAQSAAAPAAAPQTAPPVVQPPLPTNSYAVASIITSCVSLAFLFLTAGLAAPLTGIGSLVGTVLGHKGKDDVDKGRAVQQRDLGVAGFWVGIAGMVLAAILIIAWAALITLLVIYADHDGQIDLHRELDWE